VATGRVLVVHEAESTRALIADLLEREGFTAETVASTFQCISRFVDEPARFVVLGLSGLAPAELDLIDALKREEPAPRIIVTFPGPRRDLAVQALEAGADGYVLEPFYGNELLGIVRGQAHAASADRAGDQASLVHFAREVAHAINNPLQVITLLLGKDRVTKKELTQDIPPHLDRIQEVVGYLRELGAIPERPEPIACDPAAVVERVAKDLGVAVRQTGEIREARLDDRMLEAGLRALFRALQPHAVRLAMERGTLTVHIDAGARADRALLDAVFVSSPEREVRPGLALARTLFEMQGGSLTLENDRFVARV